jgi:uncharacterized protein (TIGR03435 family)
MPATNGFASACIEIYGNPVHRKYSGPISLVRAITCGGIRGLKNAFERSKTMKLLNRSLYAALVILGAVCVTFCQVAFEVASVKPNKSGSGNSSSNTRQGGYTGTNITIRQLILNAYRLRNLQLIGGPGWVDSDRFDVNARVPENSTPDQIPLMLRALLADRFKLVVHNETKDQPIYALVLARADRKLGPQIKPSTLNCSNAAASSRASAAGIGAPAPPTQQAGQGISCGTNTNVNNSSGVMRSGGRTMAEFAAGMANFVADRMVIDRTGLTGEFDFELRWTPDNLRTANAPADASTPDAPSIFAALQEQLGLKLEAQRGPVEFLVIDKVEQPIEN